MRGLESRRIVDAVASHRHDLSVRLQSIHDSQLLLRHNPRKNIRRIYRPLQLFVTQSIHFGSRYHQAAMIESCLLRNLESGSRIVACDHEYADSGAVTFGYRFGDSWSYWV